MIILFLFHRYAIPTSLKNNIFPFTSLFELCVYSPETHPQSILAIKCHLLNTLFYNFVLVSISTQENELKVPLLNFFNVNFLSH